MLASRHRHALLLALLLAGGALRFGAVGYGLPRHDLGQDEMITAARVRHGVMTGRPGWPRFHWPNLNVHLSSGAVAAVRWLERSAGLEAHDDVLIGRAYTAALGTLSLLALYLAAARLFDPPTGLGAAALLAAVPLHAFRSRLWVPDVPMTFFYTLALLAAVWILVRPTYIRFALAGIAVGLATASKYNGVGACLPVATAALLALPRIADRRPAAAVASRLALAGGMSVAAFFAADPLALFRFDDLLAGIGFIRGAYIDAPASGLLGWHIWSYVAASFFGGGYEGVGPLISSLAVAGWAILVLRRSRAGVLAWLPAVLYLLAFSLVLHDPYERMFLPLAPHLALLASVALIAGARRVASRAGRPRRAALVAGGVVLAVLAIAAVPATRQALAARHDETRVRAAAWLDANVPAGAFVFREWDMIRPSARHFGFNRRIPELWGDDWTPELVSHSMDFVVTTSTNFERVRRQRRRPEFARQAGFYDEMFGGPLFELAARFEPGWHSFGPEVRIYRSLHVRGPVLGPARTQLDLLRQMPWVSTLRLRQEHDEQGGFRFRAPHELIAGKVSVRPGGWYDLEVDVVAAGSAPLEVGLGGELRTFRVAGDETRMVRAFLRPGKNWWRVGSGAGFDAEDQLSVLGARLARPTAAARGAAGGASTDPHEPKWNPGG